MEVIFRLIDDDSSKEMSRERETLWVGGDWIIDHFFL